MLETIKTATNLAISGTINGRKLVAFNSNHTPLINKIFSYITLEE